MSNHTDRRGHWPAGKSRNAPRTPRGWESVPALIAAVNDRIARHGGNGVKGTPSLYSRHTLAEHLGIARSSLRSYLDGRSVPPTAIAKALADWLRFREKRGKG